MKGSAKNAMATTASTSTGHGQPLVSDMSAASGRRRGPVLVCVTAAWKPYFARMA